MEDASHLEPIPRPPGHLLVGNLFDLDAAHPMEGLAELARKYGPIYRLEVPGLGSRIMVSSFELVDPLCDESQLRQECRRGPTRAGLGPGRTRPLHLRDAGPELAQGAQCAFARFQHGRNARLPPAHARYREPTDAEMGAAERGRHGGRPGRPDAAHSGYDRALRLRLPVQLILSRNAASIRRRHAELAGSGAGSRAGNAHPGQAQTGAGEEGARRPAIHGRDRASHS